MSSSSTPTTTDKLLPEPLDTVTGTSSGSNYFLQNRRLHRHPTRNQHQVRRPANQLVPSPHIESRLTPPRNNRHPSPAPAFAAPADAAESAKPHAPAAKTEACPTRPPMAGRPPAIHSVSPATAPTDCTTPAPYSLSPYPARANTNELHPISLSPTRRCSEAPCVCRRVLQLASTPQPCPAHVPARHGCRPSARTPTANAPNSAPDDIGGCNIGHHSGSPHKSIAPRPPFAHTVATDLLGPLPKTKEGHQHMLTVTEFHTRMRFICLLRERKQTPRYLSDLLQHIVSHTGKRKARIRCDNANEYLTRQVLALSRKDGFTLDPPIPHTPQQNAIAEQFNRTLIARVRATLSSMQLPFDKYWSFCSLNTTEKLNLMRQSTINAVPRDLWDTLRSPRSRPSHAHST